MPPSPPSVAVVLVTWNAEDDLPTCVERLAANTHYPSWRLVVVDNASQDRTRAYLAARAREVLGGTPVAIHLLDENIGWVRALNRATRFEVADTYFFLNPDAFVEPEWLWPLVRALDADAAVGFAAPKFRYPDGSVHYAGAYVGRSLSVRVRGHGAADDGSFDAPAGTPFAHGMCLVRRAVLDAVGGFDEGFGLGYFEELDLQLRARRKGFRVAYVPESVIVHATSKAFDRHPGGLKEELLARNWLRVMALHWPLRWLVARAPIDLARPARAWLDGADARPSLRALRTFAGMLPEVLARRRAIARSGPLDLAALRRETLDASHVNEPDTSREGDR